MNREQKIDWVFGQVAMSNPAVTRSMVADIVDAQEYAPDYVVELSRETDGRWIADHPNRPHAVVYGATAGEAVENLIKAIESGK